MSSSLDFRVRRAHRARAAVSAAFAALTIAATVAGGPPGAAAAEATTFDEYAQSSELAGDHADVFRLYWAFFDRKPEVGGAKYWVRRYDQCASLLDITWSFGNSTEFVNTYGSLSDRDYVTLVYANVLDRTPDEKGYTYWLELLSSGSLDRSGLMLYFSLGDEFRRRRPLPSDGVAYGGCTQPTPVTTTTEPSSDVYYANCTEARDAGAAPILRGEPGYRSALDRDDDGIACEVT